MSERAAVYVLLIGVMFMCWAVLYLAKQLRELREDNKDLRGANEALMEHADQTGKDVHVFDPPPVNVAVTGLLAVTDADRLMDGWYTNHPSVDEQRKTQAAKVTDDWLEEGNR